MNINSVRSRTVRFAAALGLTALFAGVVAQTPAHADDDWRFHRNRSDIRFDVVAIRHDEDRLHDLYRRRDYLRGRRDWRGVAELDVQIGGVRFHLDNDRYDARRDFNRDRYYGDHADYRTHDYDRDHYRPVERDFNRERYSERYNDAVHNESVRNDGYRVRDGR